MKKKLFPIILINVCLILGGCSTKKDVNSGILEKGAVYIGKSGTSEIIEVESKESWKIKDRHKDNNTYSIVSVTHTGEKIGEYNIIRVIATDIVGDNTSFADHTAQDFIVAENEEGLYFELIGDTNKESVTENLKKAENKVEYIKKIANYEFTKQ